MNHEDRSSTLFGRCCLAHHGRLLTLTTTQAIQGMLLLAGTGGQILEVCSQRMSLLDVNFTFVSMSLLSVRDLSACFLA
jgi:hypothetical protein